MMYVISKSNRIDKKYQVRIFRHVGTGQDRHLTAISTIHFGSPLHNDFTTFPRDTKTDIEHANTRRQLYILRHQKNENWTDAFTAGFWSYWILWHLPTIKQSIEWLRRNKNMDVYFRTLPVKARTI